MSSDIDVEKYEFLPILKRSITTADGNAGGTTLIDSTLVEANNFWTECWVMLRTGTYAKQLRQVTAFDLATNTITLDHTAGGQILKGTQYVMGVRIPTVDSGVHSNPEKWIHDNHWEAAQVTIAAAGAPGQQNLDVVVPAGVTRRIRTIHVRHAGTNNTVVTLLIAGGAVKRSWDVPAQTTRVISSEDGWSFAAGQQPAVQTSDVTGGSTYVGAEGVQA
jgi:hypothetical protein